MIHDYKIGGIQIGPKYDANGAHVSVYWWQDNTDGYSIIAPLIPGSQNRFSIISESDGYHCFWNGKDVFDKQINLPQEFTEVSSEATQH